MKGSPSAHQNTSLPVAVPINTWQGNVLPALFRANILKEGAATFDQSEDKVSEAVNRATKEAHKIHAINDAKFAKAKTKPDRHREFLAQRKEFIQRREAVKGDEIRIADSQASVKQYEQEVNLLIKKKKQATAEMRLGDEWSLENQIRLRQADVEQAKHDLAKWQAIHKRDLQHFREFDREGLQALAEELGETLGNLEKV